MASKKSTDAKHQKQLDELKKKARSGKSDFSRWAREAEENPEEVYADIMKKLGGLKINEPWSVFASIYNEDTPDKVFNSVADFADNTLKQQKINNSDIIIDLACGTGAVSRLMHSKGYSNITGVDECPQMLLQAKDLSTGLDIKYIQQSIQDLNLSQKASAVLWLDFSSNFALGKDALKTWLQQVISNMRRGGILIFDIRTLAGWQVDFFKTRLTFYQTDNFQRIWINLPDYDLRLITFDIFIRLKAEDGSWEPWRREQMTEKMWSLDDVLGIVDSISGTRLLGVYDDEFESWAAGSVEPDLPRIVVKV